MMSSGLVTLEAVTDRSLVDADVPSQRFVEWTLKIASVQSEHDRPPLNIALVIDRSGSMGEDRKMPYVHEAACHVIDLLEERDRVSLVAFDDDIDVISGSEPGTTTNKSRLKAAVRELQPRGCTDLAGGWLRGAREVADRIDPEAVNRALLLSDGMANRGITDQEELAHHARELMARGVSTSTFGVGLEFDEHLMEAVASSGGGHYHYIERSHDIVRVFATELGEMLATVAKRARLEFRGPKGTAIELLGDLPHTKTAAAIRVELGDLCSSERRTFHLKVLTPPGSTNESVHIEAKVTFLGDDRAKGEAKGEAVFTYAPAADVAAARVDHDVLRRSGEKEMEHAVRDALARERVGDVGGAMEVMNRSLVLAGCYLAEDQKAEYSALADQMVSGLSDEQRKRRHDLASARRMSRQV